MGAVEITSAVADTFTAIATCGAVFVASQGLQAWRKELKGRAEFEGARELAKSTYALRDALSAYRSPLLSSHEFPDGDMRSPEGNAAMFQSRWRPVGDALVKFDLATLEAEALWGGSCSGTGLPTIEMCEQAVRRYSGLPRKPTS